MGTTASDNPKLSVVSKNILIYIETKKNISLIIIMIHELDVLCESENMTSKNKEKEKKLDIREVVVLYSGQRPLRNCEEAVDLAVYFFPL